MKLIVAGTGWPEIISLINDINSCSSEKIDLLGYVDDHQENAQRCVGRGKYLGSFEIIKQHPEALVINTISRTARIRYLSTQKLLMLGAKFCNLVHPDSNISEEQMGVGNIIGSNFWVDHSSSIGNHNHFLRNIIIGHDSKIDDFVFLGHGVVINGFVRISDCTFIGANSVVGPDVVVERRNVISPCTYIGSNTLESTTYLSRVPQQISPTPSGSIHYWDNPD